MSCQRLMRQCISSAGRGLSTMIDLAARWGPREWTVSYIIYIYNIPQFTRCLIQSDVSPSPNICIEFLHALEQELAISSNRRSDTTTNHLRFRNLFHTNPLHTRHDIRNPRNLTRLVPPLDHRIRTPLLFLHRFRQRRCVFEIL
jgi:hypothetical protein